MKKKPYLIWWIVALLFFVCSVPLVFTDLVSGVCGIVLSLVFAYIGYRKLRKSKYTANSASESVVYITEKGASYHLDEHCCGMTHAKLVPISKARKLGKTSCDRCCRDFFI